MVIERTPELNGALHERIIRDKRVRPYGLDQFLLLDEPAGMFHKVFKCFIYLRPELYLRSAPQYTTPPHIQEELAKPVVGGNYFQGWLPFAKGPKVSDFGFSLGFFPYSAPPRLLAWAGQATFNT